jgi:uncharacterized protein
VYTIDLRYEWDEQKRLTNQIKHGLDFYDVSSVFEYPHVIVPSAHGSEARFLSIGNFEGRFVTVVYTMRGERIRIISFRRARNAERDIYQKLYSSRT